MDLVYTRLYTTMMTYTTMVAVAVEAAVAAMVASDIRADTLAMDAIALAQHAINPVEVAVAELIRVN